MKKIDRYFFVLGGVIIKSLSWTIINKIDEKNFFRAAENRKELYQLEDDYSFGKIKKEKFFEEVIRISKIEISLPKYESLIIQETSLIEGLRDILYELNKDYSLFLYSQYTSDITLSILSHLKLTNLFKEKYILYSPKVEVHEHKETFFQKLIDSKRIIPARSVWIDHDPKRTTLAIRADLDAIIFVDCRRLRREIALRGYLPLLGDE